MRSTGSSFVTAQKGDRMLIKIVTFAIISILIYFAIALILILSQWPGKIPRVESLDFSQQVDQPDQHELTRETYKARDGVELAVLHLKSNRENAPLLILLHGSSWHGQQFDNMVQNMVGMADILVPDLRGHGVNPKRRGDVDYLGQYDDDLADLIKTYAREGQKIVLGGHSSGGGLVVRFAGGPHGNMIDGAIIMAPFLKYNAPTTRPNSGGWAHPLTRRLIGLSMLNNVRISVLNHLIVMQFAMPQQVLDGPLGHTATLAYSHRLNQSFAPRNDYKQDIAALPKFILIAGTKDEAFFADQYQPLMQEITDKGSYHLVDGVNHLDIVNAPQTRHLITEFLKGF